MKGIKPRKRRAARPESAPTSSAPATPVTPATPATPAAGWLPSGPGERALFLAGVNLMLLSFILVQHTTLTSERPEIPVVVFSLSYFTGVSLGYLVSDRLSASAVRRLLPLFMLAQMALLLGMQPLQHVIVSAVEPWAVAQGWPRSVAEWSSAAALFLLVAGLATSLHAVFLPRMIDGEGGDLRRAYSIEVAGSLLGLGVAPLLAASSHEALLGGYFVSFVALAHAASVGRVVLGGMAIAAAVFLAGFGGWDRAVAGWCYARRYGWKGEEIVHTRYTPYHKIEVVRSAAGDRHRLLLNGRRQFGGDPRRIYAYYMAEYPARILGAPRVCLLGCGSMATVGRIGDFVPSVTIVDLDAEVFAASKRYLQKYNRLDDLHNWTFEDDDAKHWLAGSTDRFDLILHDIPPAESRQVALTYTDAFFGLVKARLTPGGLFAIAAPAPSRSESGAGSRYGKRVLRTLQHVFERSFALLVGNSVYFYGGGAALLTPSREALVEALAAEHSSGVTVLRRGDLDEMVKDEIVITTSNVGDLIYE